MEDVSRREAIGLAAGAAALAGLMPNPVVGDEKPDANADEQLDRQRVLSCGFTQAEADCWLLLNRTAGKFLELPKLHVMDDHEIAHAIHVLQYRLLSRPAYRQYKTPSQPEKK